MTCTLALKFYLLFLLNQDLPMHHCIIHHASSFMGDGDQWWLPIIIIITIIPRSTSDSGRQAGRAGVREDPSFKYWPNARTCFSGKAGSNLTLVLPQMHATCSRASGLYSEFHPFRMRTFTSLEAVIPQLAGKSF
uniref:Uncharacterized protein n=1 Tax=Vitis vinifera TaxID=29760 RepID=F6HXE5_VITVI